MSDLPNTRPTHLLAAVVDSSLNERAKERLIDWWHGDKPYHTFRDTADTLHTFRSLDGQAATPADAALRLKDANQFWDKQVATLKAEYEAEVKTRAYANVALSYAATTVVGQVVNRALPENHLQNTSNSIIDGVYGTSPTAQAVGYAMQNSNVNVDTNHNGIFEVNESLQALVNFRKPPEPAKPANPHSKPKDNQGRGLVS